MTNIKANEALQEALRMCDVEGMKNALRFGADVNMWLDYESVPLVAAAGECYYPGKAARAAEMVALLLATPGIKVNKPDGAGCTALLLASDAGCVDVVAQLLAVPGIDVNKADEEGVTPLAAAMEKGFTEVIALLEAAGASTQAVADSEADKDEYENEDIVKIALETSAAAKELGEDIVGAIVEYYIDYEYEDAEYNPAWFEGWTLCEDKNEAFSKCGIDYGEVRERVVERFMDCLEDGESLEDYEDKIQDRILEDADEMLRENFHVIELEDWKHIVKARD